LLSFFVIIGVFMNKGYILITVGAAALAYGLYSLYRVIAFKKWSTVKGRIITATKSTKRVNFEKMEDVDIAFEYEVEQKVYRSTSIRASGQHSSKPAKNGPSEADNLLSEYPEGSEVTVYYNPALPRMACLEQGTGQAMLIGLIFGPLAIIIGYFFFL
jgi:hypothetical protein